VTPGFVSTPNLLNLVSSATLVRPGFVSTPNLLNLVSTATLLIPGFVSTPNLLGLVSVATLSFPGFVSTPNLLSLVSTSYLSSQLNSTVIGLGTIGYVSSFFNISSISAQQLLVSSIGVGCNTPYYQLDVVGVVHANIFSTFTTLASSYTGNLGDAQTLILWEV
jgi:hypothetical protein